MQPFRKQEMMKKFHFNSYPHFLYACCGMKSIQYQYHIRRLMVVDVDTFQMHLVRTTTHLITTAGAGCCNVAVQTFSRTYFFLISLSLYSVGVFVLFCPWYLFLLFLQLLVVVVVVCFSLFLSFKQVLVNLSAKLIVKCPFSELILFNIIVLRSTTILFL